MKKRARAAQGGGQRPRRKAAAKTAPKRKGPTSQKTARRIRKADVIGPIARESARMLRIARDLGEERSARPVDGGWSVRDVVAHCVYWQGMLARMMGSPLPPPSWIPRWQSEDEIGQDELNRLTVEHYRPVAFTTVLSDFRFTADLVKRIVGEMREENLVLEAGQPWDEGTKIHEAIAGETHAHWKEHADRIEAALKAAAPKGGGRRPTAEKKELPE